MKQTIIFYCSTTKLQSVVTKELLLVAYTFINNVSIFLDCADKILNSDPKA